MLAATAGAAGALACGGAAVTPAAAAVLWQSEWLHYKDRYLDGGRVIDTANDAISHSEGQGYGMLLAVAYDDRAAFDALRAWTWDVLGAARDDGLLAWVWDPAEQAVTDPNAASDGDLLVAWATLRAADKWDAPELRAEALAHLEALVAETVIETRFGPTLLPGPFGFEAEGGPVLNPSYWVFPALAEIGEATGDPVWSGLIDSGLALLDEARFGRFNLTGDWVKATLPPGLPEDFPPVFGFNAIRVPMHLVWARRVPGVAERLEDHLAPYRQFWSLFDGAGTIPATVDLATGEFADYGLSPGGRAITVITRFAGRSEYAWALLPRLGPDQPYFSASLLLLSKLALLEGDA